MAQHRTRQVNGVQARAAKGDSKISVPTDADRKKELEQKVASLRGTIPTSKPSRDEFIKTHDSHLEAQKSLGTARPVKKIVLDQEYPASTKALAELQRVRRASFDSSFWHHTTC
jgi:hypothetical protein